MKTRRGLAVAPLILLAATTNPPAIPEFIGKYPSDKVWGVSFLEHPTVRRAVERAAPNRMLSRQVLSTEVSGPVSTRGSFIAASSCQAHNCPGQNWAVAVDWSSGRAAICYFQADLTDGARWFVDKRLVERVADRGCDDDPEWIPAAVLTALRR